MERLVVAGLPPRLELDGEAWADGTGAVGEGWSRTGRARWPGRQGPPCGFRENSVGTVGGHANRCSRNRAAGHRSWNRPVYRMFTMSEE